MVEFSLSSVASKQGGLDGLTHGDTIQFRFIEGGESNCPRKYFESDVIPISDFVALLTKAGVKIKCLK